MSTEKQTRQRQFPKTISTTAFAKFYTLHLLKERPFYGNEIRDEIKERMNGHWHPSPGMIYPILTDLEKAGYIIGKWDQPKKRNIKRYNITDSGLEHYDVLYRKNKTAFDNSLSIIKTVLFDIYGESI